MRHLYIVLICLIGSFATAQTPSKIADKTKNMKRYDGYFTFWWDAANGKIWLQVDEFDKEFLYVNSLPSGLGSNDIGLDRGLIGGTRIVTFNKVGKKLFLVQPNYSYRASSADKNEQRAVKESFAQSTIGSFVIDEDEGEKVLVDATSFFVRDAQNVADRIRIMRQGTYTFSEPRSAMYLTNTKNFPLNSEFEATITFTGGSDAGRFVSTVTPSADPSPFVCIIHLYNYPMINTNPAVTISEVVILASLISITAVPSLIRSRKCLLPGTDWKRKIRLPL